MCFGTERGHHFTIRGKFLFYSTFIHSYVILKMCFYCESLINTFMIHFLSLEANFSCVFYKDKVFNHERLIYVKNTKKINVFTYFYFKKALFTLCITSFVGESFKLN